MLQLCVSSTLIKLTTSDWSRCVVVVPLLWCGAAVVVCCGVVQAGAGRLKRVPRVMALVSRP